LALVHIAGVLPGPVGAGRRHLVAGRGQSDDGGEFGPAVSAA
jgi:hypothetical protein